MSLTPETLSALCAEAKKEEARARIDRENADRSALYALLASDAPKTRKNTARLIGALKQSRDAAALANALASEDTLFAVPSILLALGSVGGNAAREALAAYEAPVPKDETEQKHCTEISDALRKARAALSAGTPLQAYAPAIGRACLCRAPEGFDALLASELRALGFSPEQTQEGCLVSCGDWKRLTRAACMSELLLPLARGVPAEADAIAAIAAAELSVPYRIELKNYEGDRAAFLRTLVAACGGENNPSHYALELRVSCAGARCDLDLKPSFADMRYPWRARTVSASMQPALGACLARLAAAYVTRPCVYDPCCGSGTLLFSCEQAFPCASLIGTDISGAAVAAARENAAAGKSRARFVQKDTLRFLPREKADLVISNLPFGNRVGSHETNLALYEGLVKRLPELMKPDGTAILYTMEYRLLSACLEKQPRLILEDLRRTEAGGLCPWVFLLRPAART